MKGPINLYNIYYGDYHGQMTPTGTRTLIDYLAANIGNSSWYDTVTNYYQVNSDGSRTYASHKVNFSESSVNISPAARGSTVVLDDDMIVTSLINLFNSLKLPVDTSGIYAVMFRGDFTYSGWLSEWCGFHQNFALSDGRLMKYFVLGDLNYVPSGSNVLACAQVNPPTVNSNFGADSMASVYAHEVAELVTDYAQAWYSNAGSNLENGDACAWQFSDAVEAGTTNWNEVVGNKKYLLQKMFLPGVGCV